MKKVEIYTDGACRGNPGVGGWGALLRYKTDKNEIIEKELFGGAPETTNNQMELKAAIEGLASLKQACEVTLTTDSQYVRKGITEWINSWKQKGWKTAAKKPVKNEQLWKELDKLNETHVIDWQWVKGHAGHPENERADELANKGIDSLV